MNRDGVSDRRQLANEEVTISGSVGGMISVIDTLGLRGVAFFAQNSGSVTAGATFSFMESDHPDMSDPAPVDAQKIIGNAPGVNTGDGEQCCKAGVFSVKRYIQAMLNGTDTEKYRVAVTGDTLVTPAEV